MPYEITVNTPKNCLEISLAQFICDRELPGAYQKIISAQTQLSKQYSVLLNFNKSEITHNKRIFLEFLHEILPKHTSIAIVCDRQHCPSLHFSLLIFSRFTEIKFFFRKFEAHQWLELWYQPTPTKVLAFPEIN